MATDTPTPAVDGRSRERGTFGVGAAAGVAGLAGYGVLLVTARHLDAARYADFLAYWGALFFCYGLLTGIQGDVTRAIAVGRRGPAAAGVHILPLLMATSAAFVAVVAATAAWWGPVLLGEADLAIRTGALAIGVCAFAGHAAMAGTLGGSGAWDRYGILVALEACVRLVLVGFAAVMGTGLGGFAVAVAGASLTWLLLLAAFPAARGVLRSRSDRAAWPTLTGWWHATIAAGASAALVVGYPVLLRATSSDAAFASAAPLLLAIMLTRGPILVPLGAYQNVVVAHVVANDRRIAPLLRLLPRVLAAAVLVVAAAAALGPWLLDLLRPGFEVSAAMFAVLTLSALLLGALTVSGAIVLAFDQHRAYAAGWVLATMTSGLLLVAPVGLDARVAASLLVGPLVGVAWHLMAATRATDAPTSVW